MNDIQRQVAGFLLQTRAVKLRPEHPFTWASGWKSPVYCDNRLTLSHPPVRDYIKKALRHRIEEHFSGSDLIAGVATGAIAQGALVADLMELPFVYVRSSVKEHGRKNLVEGELKAGMRTVVVEDLVSTGGSSLKAVSALRDAGAEVAGMVAIFSYGFPEAARSFEEQGVRLVTLTDYSALIELARETGYIMEAQLELLTRWRKDPSSWPPHKSTEA